MTKCNNRCLKYMTCLRYDESAKDNLMQDRTCEMYFMRNSDSELDNLMNIFGMNK